MSGPAVEIPAGFDGWGVRCFLPGERQGYYDPEVGEVVSLHDSMEEAAEERGEQSSRSPNAFRIVRLENGERRWPNVAEWDAHRERLRKREREKARAVA